MKRAENIVATIAFCRGVKMVCMWKRVKQYSFIPHQTLSQFLWTLSSLGFILSQIACNSYDHSQIYFYSFELLILNIILFFNHFPYRDAFWCLCSRWLFEHIVTKEEIAQNKPLSIFKFSFVEIFYSFA